MACGSQSRRQPRSSEHHEATQLYPTVAEIDPHQDAHQTSYRIGSRIHVLATTLMRASLETCHSHEIDIGKRICRIWVVCALITVLSILPFSLLGLYNRGSTV